MFNNKGYKRITHMTLPIVTVGDQKLSADDQLIVHDALRLWMLTSLDVLPELDLDYYEIFFLLHNPLNAVEFTSELKASCQKLRHCEETDYLVDIGDLNFLLKYGSLESPEYFRAVHHCLTFLLKMPVANPALAEEAVDKFLATERRLSEVNPSDSAIAHLREVIQEWFADWDVDFLPGHGPGSTSDAGASLQEKEAHLGTDELLVHLCPEWLKYMGPNELSRTFMRRSKMVLVPKTADSLRPICMEPATLQYWQKSVMRAFMHVFDLSEIGWHVHLDKQIVNQQAALMASRTGEYATIDLSAASDSVLLSVVERVFPYHILRSLISVRSTEIELPDGRVISPLKYAPMGSSVTFPLECTIFSGICQMACESSAVYPDQENPVYWVYGDDIVCRNDILPRVLGLLEEFGFVVNERKSFTRNTFRESCGVFAFKGVDITTPYIPRDFRAVSSPIQAACFEQRISLANQLLVAGMMHARAFVLENLPKDVLYTSFEPAFLSERRDLVPGVKDDTYWCQGGVWTFAARTNTHLKVRAAREFRPSSFVPQYLRPPINQSILCITGPSPRFWGSGAPDYCRTEYRHVVEVTEGYRERYNDSTRYIEWLRSAARRTGSGDVITVPIGYGPRRRLRVK